MEKLSITKKELSYNLGIGVAYLILGIVSYLDIPNIISLIIVCSCFIPIFFALIPFFTKTDKEDELSESIRNESATITLKLGLVVMMIVSALVKFKPISQIVLKGGIINLIIAFFFIFYSITYIVKTKKIDEPKESFEEN